MSKATLTPEAIESMAKVWYDKLDVHAPMIEILPMLSSEEEVFMVFPEATLKGLAAFEAWYQGVIRIFFDEVHVVKSVKSTVKGDEAEVKVVVQWEASAWTPPARYSKRIKLDAYQTWVVKLSTKTGTPVITKSTVDELKYHEGYEKL
jgi:hypothetical protein